MKAEREWPVKLMFRAVVFDVDGVLTRINSIWRFIHEELGVFDRARENARRYYAGKITYEEWAKLDVELWKGLRYEKLISIVNKVPLRGGAKEVVKRLKNQGLITVAISAGLSLIANRVAKELGMDYVFSNDIVVKDGVVTGEVVIHVKADNKDKVMENFCKLKGLRPIECIVVGDSLVDVPMFKISGLSIAFNPTREEVAESADVIVFSEDLRAVLPVIFKALGKTLSE